MMLAGQINKYFVYIPAILWVMSLTGISSAGEIPEGSVVSDSLSLPGEVFVLTAEDLRDYNINTFDDILEIIPGVSYWREGPPGSSTGFSIGGRGSRGVNLLVNGVPLTDIYKSEALVKFVDLSRVKRVEVIYSGSPALTGHISNNGSINIVLERGGRETPFAQANFTYGANNRRARRIWFSTPESYINGTIIYNGYLQDFYKPLQYYPERSVGKDHAKSVSMEVSLGRDPGNRGVVHFTRFEDLYEGTACSSRENIRSRGFDSQLHYRYDDFKMSVRNFGFEKKGLEDKLSGLRSSVSLGLEKELGRAKLKSFFSGRRDIYENRFEGKNVDPEVENYEGGFILFSPFKRKFALRAGFYGGDHSEAGNYLGGEFGITHKGGGKSYETLILSRKLVLPSSEMLFHPEPDTVSSCYDLNYIANRELQPEIAYEISAEKSFSSGISVNLFLRHEDRYSRPAVGSGILYNSSETQKVSGVKAEYSTSGKYRQARYGYNISGEYFINSNEYRYGVPEYRVNGNFYLKIPVFKGTETLTLRFNSIETGRRDWGSVDLEPAAVQNFSSSITLMSALIKLQVKNIMNSAYQTVPGYYMSERHFRIGIIWDLVN
ncbi:MAG TPA: TonB-dependent receptor plug domain-containing protein [Candidatus Krumholzibacteriaceae bacterium]|nr:TonB-dependent receptor plug domain-containing protein [Candidatus Krumholzibacteriaceae bacterium]